MGDVPRFEIPEIPLTEVQSCARPHSRWRCLANRRRPQKLVMLSHYRNDEMIAICSNSLPILPGTCAPSFVAIKKRYQPPLELVLILPEYSQKLKFPNNKICTFPKKKSSSDKNEDHNEQSETSNLHQSSCRGDSTFYLRSAMYRWWVT